jgi:hypothetical protein
MASILIGCLVAKQKREEVTIQKQNFLNYEDHGDQSPRDGVAEAVAKP